MPYVTGTETAGVSTNIGAAFVTAGWTSLSASSWLSGNGLIQVTFAYGDSNVSGYQITVDGVSQGTFYAYHGSASAVSMNFILAAGPSWFFLRLAKADSTYMQTIGCSRINPYVSGEVDNRYVSFGGALSTANSHMTSHATLSGHTYNAGASTRLVVPVRLAHATGAVSHIAGLPDIPENSMTAVNGSPIVHPFVVISPVGSGVVGALHSIYFLTDSDRNLTTAQAAAVPAEGAEVYIGGKVYRVLGLNESSVVPGYSPFGGSNTTSGNYPRPIVLVQEGV